MKNQIAKSTFRKRRISLIAAAFMAISVFNHQPLYAEGAEVAEAVETTPAEQTDPLDADSETNTDASSAFITAIASLSEDVSAFSFDEKPSLDELTANFPAALSMTLSDSAAVDVPVTWSCEDDYDNTDGNVYTFFPSWDTAAYPLSEVSDTDIAIPHITVNIDAARTGTYLTDMEKAQSSLDELAKSKPLLALVYLCDSYEVKQLPGEGEETVASAVSGQSVQITGVSEDAQHNIWYHVSIPNGDTSYQGYVQREYLAYSDEDLLAWEQENITVSPEADGYSMQLYSAAPGVTADIMQFPDSYQDALISLKSAHPNWIFVKMDTGVDWNTAVKEENSNARSLISSSVNAAWKTGPYDSDNAWSYPTDGILSYYMDPRNFLKENSIFQFELLSYNKTYHTENAVQSILNDTFMSGQIPGDGRGYAQVFCSIAQELDVSPFHLASRVRQEQGKGTSPLISGTYPGYENLYNYFNIGATGKSDAEVITRGLKKAREYGWTNRYLSLRGGSEIISKNYIRKGQNTLYLQKFNVNKESSSGLYNHQYMQNIAAPSTEAVSVKKAYATAGSINNPFVFRIPVFNNMPNAACPQPSALKEVKLNKTSLSLKVNQQAALTATIDGKAADASSLTYKSSHPDIVSVASDGKLTALLAGNATITCSASGAASAACTVTVTKAEAAEDPNYSEPKPSEITYDPAKTLGDIILPKGWKWDNPSIIPTVNNSGYSAAYTPADTNKYNTLRKSIPLSVLKATPSYQIPNGLESIAGVTLASLRLPAGFSWDAPDTEITKSASYPASYNPDPANYETVSGISIPVTVTKKDNNCTSHSYGEWIVKKEPTCTEKGSQERICSSCGKKETAEIPALSHDYVAKVTKPATESDTGIRTYTCSRCNDSYTETIEKLPASHKHQYSEKVTAAATCTNAGTKTYTCSCGDTYTKSIPAAGHSYTSAITKKATEKEEGVRTYTCTACKDSYTEAIPKLPSSHTHSYTSSVSRQASCTEKGVRSYTCSCGDTYTEEIPALGHDMADGKCRRCGYQDPNHSNAPSNQGNTGSSNNTSGNNNESSTHTPDNNNQNGAGNNSTNSGSSNNSNAGSSNTGSSAESSADKPAPNHHATIDMTETTVLYEEAISSIRGKDIDVILNMGNSISWTINGSNIVADEANGVDMGIKVNAKVIPEEIMTQAAALSETGTLLELSLAHDGPLDFQPILTIHTASDNAGRMASLFYYNPEKNALEFVEETEVTSDGEASFTFSHASDYAVIISDSSIAATKTITAPDNTEQAASVENAKNTETSTVTADKNVQERPAESLLKPTTIFIIVIILLVVIALGFTAFYIWKSREDDYEDGYHAINSEEDNLDTPSDDANIEFIDEFSKDNSKQESSDDNEFKDEFEDDEFDGFE